MRKASVLVSALLLFVSVIGVALTLSGQWGSPAGRWVIGLVAGVDVSFLLGFGVVVAARTLRAGLARKPLKANVALAAFCGFLMVFALSVTLNNTSALAMLFEPNIVLAWAWAAFIDLALLGFTVALAWFTAQKMRPWIVLCGFGFFVMVSTVANILVSQDRLLNHALIASLRTLPEFFWTVGLVYSLSIPLAVFIFGKTIVDALTPRQGAEELRGAKAEEQIAVERKALTPRRAAQIETALAVHGERSGATLGDLSLALGVSRVQAGEVRRLAIAEGYLVETDDGLGLVPTGKRPQNGAGGG